MPTITLEQMLDELTVQGDVQAVIDWAEEQKREEPKKLKCPIEPKNPKVDEIIIHTLAKVAWRQENEEYKVKLIAWKKNYDQINAVIEDFIKEVANFSIVPVEFQSNVFRKAWERGHSSGYFGIYQALDDLVDIFNLSNEINSSTSRKVSW